MPDYDLGRAKGRIEIDASSAESSVKRLDSALGKTTGRSGTFGKAARGLALGLGAVAVAGAGVVGVGVKLASDMQQAEIAFTRFLGSGEKGKAFLEDLQDFAAKTPFEFPELRDAASRLLGAGVAADKIIPVMTRVGDAVASIGGSSEQVGRATTALTQMQLKGRVTGEELLQLTEAGIPAWKVLAETMGVSVAQAQEKVSKGLVDVNVLFGALEKGAGPTLERLGGAMEAQSKSLAGLFSTLKDEVGFSLVTIAEPLVAGLTEALPKLTKVITATMEEIGPIFAEVLGEILNVIAELLPAVVPLIKLIGKLFADALKIIAPIIKTLAPVFIDLVTILGKALRPILTAVGDALTQLAPTVVALLKALMPLIPVLTDLIFLFTPLLPLIVDLLNLALKPIIPAIAALAKALAVLLGWVVRVVRAFLSWILQSKLFKTILKVVAGVVAGVIKFFAQLQQNAIKIWNAIKGFLLAVWNGIRSAARTVWNAIKTAVMVPINAVKGFLKGAWDTIKNAAKTAWNGVKDAILSAWEGVQDGIKAGVNFIIGLLNGVIDGLNVLVRGANLLNPFKDIPFIPKIPLLARGVKDFIGGLAIVGEAGPELVYLPKHSTVVPADMSRVRTGTTNLGELRDLTGLRITGRLMTQFGPADIEGMIVDEIEGESLFRESRARTRR